jgi:hypothetical protein
VLTEQEIRSKTHAAIQDLGLAETSRRLQLKPDTLARVACGALVKKGSLALVSQRLEMLEASTPLALATLPALIA